MVDATDQLGTCQLVFVHQGTHVATAACDPRKDGAPSAAYSTDDDDDDDDDDKDRASKGSVHVDPFG